MPYDHSGHDEPRWVRDLHARFDRIERLLKHQHKETLMTLDAKGQAIVSAINDSTNKIGAAVKAASQAIADLAAKAANGDIDGDELTAALQPSLDSLNAAAAGLTKTATDADPAINPTAPPIVVPVVPPVVAPTDSAGNPVNPNLADGSGRAANPNA